MTKQNNLSSVALPCYELFAIRYATRDGQRRNNFLGGDAHDAPMPMDYFIWLIKGDHDIFVVDTGFAADVAKKRGRTLLRYPKEALALLGVNIGEVKNVILTHLHYDHVGTFDEFSCAQFHLQDDEMAYATGRHMRHKQFNHGYEVDEVVGMVRMVFKDRVTFHHDESELSPGVSIHRVGGHTHGLQCVRVHTKRGWVVLASDASHYYEHFEKSRVFPTVFHVGETLDGYALLRMLAASDQHIIPGHDPLVMKRYPAPSAHLKGIAVCLDVEPCSEV